MKIFVASDHAGFEFKERLKPLLQKFGHTVFDCGNDHYDKDDDYPDFIRKAALAVANDPEGSRGIILGGSGQGEAMVANRFEGVRAAVYYSESDDMIRLTRDHNNANILSLGVRFLMPDDAERAVLLWLETSFSNAERHVRRIKKIDLVK